MAEVAGRLILFPNVKAELQSPVFFLPEKPLENEESAFKRKSSRLPGTEQAKNHLHFHYVIKKIEIM